MIICFYKYMISKVTSVNNVFFRGNAEQPAIQADMPKPHKQIKELGYVTPDFGVKVPQKYTKTSENTLPNGLKLYSYKLANGYTVSVVPMEGSPAVVKTYVNVGSMNETPDIKGISHFLEHMAFNGTNGENGHIKLETGDSFKKIDKIGGWANASTNYAITDYVNNAPLLEEKDLETQIKVLAAMSEDLKLSDDMIAKEKGPVSSEINMILDDPRTIALDQTIRSLYNIKNPADELVGGSVKHIQNLTRKDVVDYYNKYYTPSNTNIVVTGDVNPDEVIRLVSQNFISNKQAQGKRFEEKLNPINKTVRKDFKSDKAKSAEIVLGFNGPKNNDLREYILFDIASGYLKSETVGLNKKMEKYHASYGFGEEKITTNPNGNRFTYIGITSSEENAEKALQTAMSTINSAPPISEQELNRLKDAMKEGRDFSFEYSNDVNNLIGHAVIDGTVDDNLHYNEILESITPDEVNSAIKKYFDINKTAITMVHPDKNNSVSFKGKSRQPVNTDRINTTTLNNNVELGFYEVNSPARFVNIDFETDAPYQGKAGVKDILSYIYDMGTNNLDENTFKKIKEDLNLSVNVYTGSSGLSAIISGNGKNYKKGLELAKELIYNPRLTEENLQKAKEKLKENLKRQEITPNSLYFNEFYSKYNPYVSSDKKVLESIDSITLDDVKEFHKYILENSRGTVASNLPQENGEQYKQDVLEFAKSIHSVQPNNPKPTNIYKRLKHPVVLTSAQNNSQANIMQTYNFKYEDSPKNRVIANLMNSILSGSSIGLFDILREKEQLAYQVYSDTFVGGGNNGEVSLYIKTTTDNKEIGEQSYENLERSIKGFKRQIKELTEGKFTEQDLENAKRSYKARLLDNEGVYSKINELSYGMNSVYGIDITNNIYNEIDNITKEDIINFAKQAFSVNPVYSITATKDTLDANKDFIESLKKDI